MNKTIPVMMMFFLPLTSFAQYGYSAYGYANANLQGSGYWGGQQNCGYQQTQNTGRGQNQNQKQGSQKTTEDSRISELKKQLSLKQLERKRAESEMELASRKLERVFDSEVLSFLLEVHMEKGNECKDYKTFPANGCVNAGTQGSTAVGTAVVQPNGSQVIVGGSAAISSDCDGKEDVPEKLKSKWTKEGGGYCTASSRSSGGSVSSAICSDSSLRNEDRKSAGNVADCGKQLTAYRKNRIKRDEAQAKIEKIEDDIKDQEYAIADAKERTNLEKQYRQSDNMEADCEECAAMGRNGSGGSGSGPGGRSNSGRDWASILGNIGVGVGLAYVGKQYDDRNAEYSAQLGYPPQSGYPTAVSLGAPFILNGIYGAVNGSNGQGSFGCGNSMTMGNGLNGMGNMYGMNGVNGGANSAFGYPQNMLGNQVNGGGMYSMGYNPYNSMYGNTNPNASLYGNANLGYGNSYGNNYGLNTGTMLNNGYGTMSNYGLGSMTNNSQSQLLALQYQQQMAQYQMQYYQQQYQQQMQSYQQQQQVATQSTQLQQEIYNLQIRLQNLNSGYYTYGSTSGQTNNTGGYYGTYTTGSTTAPTWVPGTTSTIYTVPTTYSTTTNGR